MFPMKSRWIFQSRWMALIFAAGIIWFACDVAVSEPQDDNTQTNEATAALNAL
jgi:hypothetical protein